MRPASRPRWVRLVWLLPLAIGVACATKVGVKFDPAAEFASYRSWTWLPREMHPPGAGAPENPGLEALAQGAIRRALAARGYRRAEEGSPDFYVVYEIDVRREVVVRTETPAAQTLDSMNHSPSFVVTSSQQTRQLYDHVKLVIDVAEPRDLEVVWRGVGERRVRGPAVHKLDDLVAKVVARFPPPGEVLQ